MFNQINSFPSDNVDLTWFDTLTCSCEQLTLGVSKGTWWLFGLGTANSGSSWAVGLGVSVFGCRSVEGSSPAKWWVSPGFLKPKLMGVPQMTKSYLCSFVGAAVCTHTPSPHLSLGRGLRKERGSCTKQLVVNSSQCYILDTRSHISPMRETWADRASPTTESF